MGVRPLSRLVSDETDADFASRERSRDVIHKSFTQKIIP